MDGFLMLLGGAQDETKALTEAMRAYQCASRAFLKLTLCGLGAGSAYALMLAQRFTADALWLAPFLCDTNVLAKAMRVNRGSLFAVLAPIRLLMPEHASRTQRTAAKRVLAGVMSNDKKVFHYETDAQAHLILENAANGLRIIKTLA